MTRTFTGDTVKMMVTLLELQEILRGQGFRVMITEDKEDVAPQATEGNCLSSRDPGHLLDLLQAISSGTPIQLRGATKYPGPAPYGVPVKIVKGNDWPAGSKGFNVELENGDSTFYNLTPYDPGWADQQEPQSSGRV